MKTNKKMKIQYFFLLILLPFGLTGQNITVLRSQSENQQPDITWSFPVKMDSVAFEVLRASVKDKQMKPIQTFHYIDNSLPDTSMFVMIDTTLTEEGIYLYKIQFKYQGKTLESAVAIAHNYKMLPRPRIVSFTAVSLKDEKGVQLSWKFN